MSISLSVITICFNNLDELVKTCHSVEMQTLSPTEHLIIDGSTNTEIVDWLSSNPQPSWRRWIHERDSGISDAFNKGILASKGNLTHLLNSGDSYSDQRALEKVMAQFIADPNLKWLHSRYIQHRGDTDVISGVPFDKSQLWKGMRTVAHPTMFIKKELYDRYGLYDTKYKIAMDYDLLVRIRDEKNSFIAEPLVYFAPGGASNQHFAKGLSEVSQSYKRHIGNNYLQNLWQARQRALRAFMNTDMGKKWFRWKNRKNSI